MATLPGDRLPSGLALWALSRLSACSNLAKCRKTRGSVGHVSTWQRPPSMNRQMGVPHSKFTKHVACGCPVLVDPAGQAVFSDPGKKTFRYLLVRFGVPQLSRAYMMKAISSHICYGNHTPNRLTKMFQYHLVFLFVVLRFWSIHRWSLGHSSRSTLSLKRHG